MRYSSYRLIKIHRKFTSAYFLCDKASSRPVFLLRFIDTGDVTSRRKTTRCTSGEFGERKWRRTHSSFFCLNYELIYVCWRPSYKNPSFYINCIGWSSHVILLLYCDACDRRLHMWSTAGRPWTKPFFYNKINRNSQLQKASFRASSLAVDSIVANPFRS
jgi:hypothetical protein